jgi:hypothetical protein
MKLMATSQRVKDWEQIITSVVFYAEGQIRMGYYDRSNQTFVQFTPTGNLKFDESEVEEWFRVLYK